MTKEGVIYSGFFYFEKKFFSMLETSKKSQILNGLAQLNIGFSTYFRNIN